MSTHDIDPFELRAQHAATSRPSSRQRNRMSGLARHLDQCPDSIQPRTLFIAASVILLLLLVAPSPRDVLTRNQSLPAFQPRPLPGTRPFHAQLQPHVTFQIPVRHNVSSDHGRNRCGPVSTTSRRAH